jgi:MtN3 and saliva related transmembrane protein
VFVLLGAVASLFSVSATIPQVLRAARSRSVDGLSWSSLVLSLATFTLWCVYAAAVADQVQLVNNAIAFTLLVALAAMFLRAGGAARTWTALAAVLLSGLLAVLVVDVSNAFVLAMFGTTISSVRMWPQTRLALSRVPLWGIDPWSTVLAWVGMLLWLGYGVAVGDHALALCSAIGATMLTTIAAFRLPPRRTLSSLAHGRLGRHVARVAVPVSTRFPLRATSDYELAA